MNSTLDIILKVLLIIFVVFAILFLTGTL